VEIKTSFMVEQSGRTGNFLAKIPFADDRSGIPEGFRLGGREFFSIGC
jgi:hypothetical protein